MGKITFGFTACMFALLSPLISATPVENRQVGQLSQGPQIEPRAVTVTRHVVNSAVQVNPPYYDTACKVGGCTFAYEASIAISSTWRHRLTIEVGVSFLLPQRDTKYGLPFHPS